MVKNKMVLEAQAGESEASLTQVNGLLLPLSDTDLLVPQLAVAEVVSWGELSEGAFRPSESAASPHCYGWISWRFQDIPLLSFDSLYQGQKPVLDKDVKIVICNAVFKAAALGFYALLLTGFPRAIRLNMEAEMALEGEPSDRDAVQMCVNIDGQEALIPDFDFLEQIVCDIVATKNK
ncbi:hypothetical protein A9Q90_04205 [Gammaproteobacteria bacterium 54_18_T64]|nr:hypothetical protein A9Q90_04205 [Gammaproteobacteria bacterium 54_18_T64]